jgi:hypothetical protein
MVIAVSFIAFLTAGVTSVAIRRDQEERMQAPATPRDDAAILDALRQIQRALADLDGRLAAMESRPGA